MNRLEFNAVLKSVFINENLSTTIGRYGETEDVYKWLNLDINFGGSFYTVVRGNIPLEVANIIYNKYPENPYGIRVDGGCDDWNPANWSRNGKYIDCYHIDTKEGLLIFLLEMKDWFLRNNKLPETEVNKYQEILKSVDLELLRMINPTISGEEWMKLDKEREKNYRNSTKNELNKGPGVEFRKAIMGFDRAVNPFLNNDRSIEDVYNSLKDITIGGYVDENDNTCTLELNNNKDSCLSYYRNNDGFSFKLTSKIDESKNASLIHYYSTRDDQDDIGEYLYININEPFFNIKLRMRFENGELVGTDKPVSQSDIVLAYLVLLNATTIANQILYGESKKDSNERKLKI